MVMVPFYEANNHLSELGLAENQRSNPSDH
jgi:hypothetical protein